MNKIFNTFKFILREVGPYLGFYLLAYFFGERIALLISIIFIILEYIILKYKKQKISMLFYAFNSVIIIFAFLEFINVKTNIYQYEALLTNFIVGLFWSISVFKEKSIVQEIAESQGRTGKESSLDKRFFFNCFTLFWALYFILKGFFYFWLYKLPEVHQPLMLRFIIGKISFWIMMAISILLPEKIWKMMNKYKILPSYRIN